MFSQPIRPTASLDPETLVPSLELLDFSAPFSGQ